MSTSTQHDQLRFISFGRLSLSPLNVRKTGAEHGIEELAALIRSQGVLQSLTVYEEPKRARGRTGTYLVVAGGRRWRALQLLLKQKHITPAYEVPCLVTTFERAIEISLAENCGREAMHPADQFEAFRKLVDAGQSVEEVAARFGIAPLIVQRRLKLANVCPDFIALYRDGKITLEHLMAFAVTDDHARQQQVWKGLKPYERHPSTLRRALTQNEVYAREPLARFVGLNAYEKAGGVVRYDLFAEDDEVCMLGAALLNKLAAEKLDQHAAKLRGEGVAWVDVTPQLDYASRAAYGRVRTVLREPTEEEQAQLTALATRQQAIEASVTEAGEEEDRLAELSDQADEVEAAIEAIREQRTVPHPDQQAVAGAIVSIGPDGKLHIERGLLKPEDSKRFERTQRAQAKAAAQEAPRTHSAVLVRRLTAQRTLGLQATLAQRPDVAVIALTHRLVLKEFFALRARTVSAVEIDAQAVQLRQHVPDLDSTKAQAALATQRQALREQLPNEPQALFAWLLEQPQAQVLALLAFCVAQTIDAVQSNEGASASDALARAAGLDMRHWWTPTAESYLGSIPKARILAVVREAVSPEAAAALGKLKKAPLAKAAEQRLAGTGWLPSVLRVATA